MNILDYIKNPWIIPSSLLKAELNCELKSISENINVDNIKKELNQILIEEKFLIHKGNHSGGWGAIGLITFGGDPNNDLVTDEKIKPTRLLPKCPEVKKILKLLPGNKQRVRFMEVKPTTKVFWHYDNGETIDDLDYNKNVRLHVPIFTNIDVEMKICHEQIRWLEGKLYYGDFSFPHMIHNKSNLNRIHLVIDLEISEKLIKIMPKEYLNQRKKRLLIKKICQRSLNLFKKLKLVEKD